MRILHVLDHSVPMHSGYAFRSLAIIRQQRAMGYDTLHVTSTKHYDGTDEVEQYEELTFHRTFPTWLAKVPVLNQLDVILTLAKKIEALVNTEAVDIIHAHSPSLNALAAKRVARKYKIPLVYEMRASWEDAAVSHGTCKEGDMRYRLGQWLEKRALHSADHVTTICQGLATQISEWGVPKSRITVIPNAVDIDKFSQPVAQESVAALRQKYGLTGSQVIGFLGSFYRYEGIHILLDALALLKQSVPDVKLLLVGGGQQEAALKQQVNTLGLEPNVVFAGRVPHHDVPTFYKLVDLFVYPRESIRLTELVTPLKPLEAMAQFGVVVASDVGGHREMIRDGVNGKLFPADNAQALADTLANLLNSPEVLPEFRQNGRNYVEQERNWPASVANIKPVYEQLMVARLT